MVPSTKPQLDQYLIFLGKTDIIFGEIFTGYRDCFFVRILWFISSNCIAKKQNVHYELFVILLVFQIVRI